MDQNPPGFPREVGACPLPCGERGPCAHPRPEGLRGQDRVSGAGGPGVGAAPVHSREGSPRRALCRQRLRSLLAPPLGTAQVPHDTLGLYLPAGSRQTGTNPSRHPALRAPPLSHPRPLWLRPTTATPLPTYLPPSFSHTP